MFYNDKISMKLALHDSKSPDNKLIINTNGYAD
jgi:hypothetical protein